MKFAHFFVDHPVFAVVISVLITLLGAIAYPTLPVAQYPQIAPPDGQHHRHLSRRLRGDAGLDRRPADRGADQRGRGHALHVPRSRAPTGI
ncbi:MAG: efflux RND transporter permease subunit [Caulobacteraceae bacterium]